MNSISRRVEELRALGHSYDEAYEIVNAERATYIRDDKHGQYTSAVFEIGDRVMDPDDKESGTREIIDVTRVREYGIERRHIWFADGGILIDSLDSTTRFRKRIRPTS